MKTKISSKNKNVINIKINTEKKKHKGRKRVKHSPPSHGKSSYNSGGGYAMMPPIIINSSQPYPQAVTQPVPQPFPQPVPQYINRPHTYPTPFAQNIPVANAQPIPVNWNRSGE